MKQMLNTLNISDFISRRTNYNIIQQLNVLQYNTLNSTLTCYFEIRQAISQ